MALKLTIGGTNKASSIDAAAASVIVTDGWNQRPQATFTCVPGYIPARFAEVVIYKADETTALFGGFILSRTIQAVQERVVLSRCAVSCVGFAAYADYRYATLSYDDEVALETVLGDLVDDYLGDYGITYDGAATGITLAAFSWDHERISDGLRELGDRANRVIVIGPDKALTVLTPGGTSAPVSITDAAPNCYDCDLEDDGDIPPNKVTLICGAGQKPVTETWTSDGTATSYTTVYPASQNKQDLYPNLLKFNGVVQEPISWGDELGSGHWTWNAATHTLSAPNSGAVPSAGVAIEVAYTAQYPFEVSKDSGDTPVVEEILTMPDVFDHDQALELAQARLDQRSPQAQTVTIHTRSEGFAAGQALTIDITARGGLDATCLVTEVRTEIRFDAVRHYFVTAVGADAYRGSYLDQWRDLTSGGSSSTTIAVVSGASGSGSGGSGGGATASISPVYLGGSRSSAIALSTAAYTPVVDAVEFNASASFTGRVRVVLRARDSGVGATARLYDVTGSSSVGASDTVTSQAETKKTFLVSLTGGHEYRLEVLSSADGKGVYCLGQLEAL
jgi:hypothetical protein